MALSNERANELAMQFLQKEVERKGEIKLNPFEIKRTVHNASKQMNIPAHEIAGLMKLMYEKAYKKTIDEFDSIISSSKVEA